MVSLIGKISKGSRMDQVYLPKSRPPGFARGDFVEIIPIKKKKISFYNYNTNQLEPLKILIIQELFDYFDKVDNILIVGSFLEKGFSFQDIDVLLIGKIKEDKSWSDYFLKKLGVKLHFIILERNNLRKGLKTDPLFQMMLSKYVSLNREIFTFENEFNYKLLDLHLFKSKLLIDNFTVLTGKEKYDLVRNLIAIILFLEKKKLSRKIVNEKMEQLFGKDIINQLLENLVEKKTFLKKFKTIYNLTFNQILKMMKNEPKQG